MKIDYISDLHINHHVRFIPNQLKWEARTRDWARTLFLTGVGKVLVVAGDFSEWNRQSIWFLEEAGFHYEKVFFVTGNHDYYLLTKSQRKKYRDSKGRQQELFKAAEKIPNIQPLCRELIHYKGKTIAGDSLWYLPKTEEDWSFFKNVSNDSTYISVLDACSFEGKEGETRFLYKEAMDWYKTLENQSIDLMISHIPPVHPSISPLPRNACYDCPVPFLVSKNWICGHQHIQGHFEKEGTTFWMNALGYPDEKHLFQLHTIEI